MAACVNTDFCLIMNCLLAFLLFVTIPSCCFDPGRAVSMYLPVLLPAYTILAAVWIVGGAVQYGLWAFIAVPVQIAYTVIALLALVAWVLGLTGEGLLGCAPFILTLRSPGGPTERGSWENEQTDDGPRSTWDDDGDWTPAHTYIAYRGIKSMFDDDDEA